MSDDKLHTELRCLLTAALRDERAQRRAVTLEWQARHGRQNLEGSKPGMAALVRAELRHADYHTSQDRR